MEFSNKRPRGGREYVALCSHLAPMASSRERPPRQFDVIEALNEDAVVVRIFTSPLFLTYRSSQRICNNNSNVNNITGCRDVYNNNSVTSIVVLNASDHVLRSFFEAPRTRQARAIGKRLVSSLEAAGVSPEELRATLNIISEAEDARHASIGSRQHQHVPATSVLDFTRGIPLPGMHELRLAWGLILDSLRQLRDLTRTANSRPTMTAVVGVTMLVAQDRRIRMACAALSVGLFALGKPYNFFKFPNVPHFIVVIDFFDKEVQISLSEAASSVVLQSRLSFYQCLANCC